jgi:hypothetical protein
MRPRYLTYKGCSVITIVFAIVGGMLGACVSPMLLVPGLVVGALIGFGLLVMAKLK